MAGPPRPLGRMWDHLRLVTRMARATGADLVCARDEGRLSQEDWAGMVNRCRSCAWSVRCGDWLDRHGEAGTAPGICLNRARLGQLRSEQAGRRA